MRSLRVLTLLLSAVLLCSAAPGLEPLTCSEGNGLAAADKALHHINEYHDHGYKFRLHEVQGNKVEKVDGGCNVKLQLDLRETKCHIINPKPFEDCEIREEGQRGVMANCTVLMTIKDGDANITKYECDTKQVKTNAEMASICPDCPVLLPRNNSESLKSVREAIAQFNKNISNQHYYILKEVGRVSAGYIMSMGMNFYTEFALVETRCPMGSRIVIEACIPLCPDRARHAFCTSSYSSEKGLQSTECDFYPAVNTTALGPSEEPVCRHHGRHRPHGHGHGHGHHHTGSEGHRPHSHGGPPSHSHEHGHGPPPHAGKGGPPPHSHEHGHGPPPHSHEHGHEHSHGHPPHGGSGGHSSKGSSFFRPCHGSLVNPDPALHPICPWPLPHRKHM